MRVFILCLGVGVRARLEGVNRKHCSLYQMLNAYGISKSMLNVSKN